jgi:molybdopterin/thiamine biosynthesis adenylyltransferase
MYHRTLSFTRSPERQRLKHGLRPLLIRLTRGLSATGAPREFLASVKRTEKGLGLLFLLRGETLRVYYAGTDGLQINEPAWLTVPGPRMQRLRLLPLEEPAKGHASTAQTFSYGNSNEEADSFGRELWRNRYGRLAGALGNGNVEAGFELLIKASELKVVVVGAGRAGSWLAFRLAACGVGSNASLVIVDPDMVEESNLPDMLVPFGAVGWPKAQAVASTITAMIPDSHVTFINSGLASQEAVGEICSADIVFTAVDEDSARLGVAVTASRYHVVHFDVAGGSSWIDNDHAVSGGEVRCFIPGSHGCLVCMSQPNWREASRLLGLNVRQERTRRAGLDWREQKGGSSADILWIVLGETMQNFWALLRGDLKESFWWHYGKGRNRMPAWSEWSRRQSWLRCRVCGRQSGLGDIVESERGV